MPAMSIFSRCKRWCLMLLCAVSLVSSLPAAPPDPSTCSYDVDVWRGRDGMPQHTMRAILQSQDGYLWLGSQEGLMRFDGFLFNAIEHPSVKGRMIWAMHEDSEGRLWVATDEPSLVCLRNGVFKTVAPSDGTAPGQILSITSSADGSLLLGTTGNGVMRLQDGRMTPLVTMDNGLSTNMVRDVLEDSDGTLWIGTTSGLARWRDGRLSIMTTADGLPDDAVFKLAERTPGEIWIGTAIGLARLRDGEVETLWTGNPSAPQRVMTLWVDGDGSLWMGTYGQGLFHIVVGAAGSKEDIQILKVPGLPSTLIHSVSGDREGSTWVGSYGGGLSRLHQDPFTSIGVEQGLSGNIASVMLQGRDERIWIGTWGDGLNVMVQEEVSRIHGEGAPRGDFISAMHEDPDGTLWVGTWGRGLYRRVGEVAEHIATGDLQEEEDIWSMARIPQGPLWVGTSAGLVQLAADGATQRLGREDGLAHDRVVALAVDGQGALWAGSFGGLNRVHQGNIDTYTTADGLPDDRVYALHVDADDRVWMGTHAGLVVQDAGVLKTLTTAHGLCDDKLFNIQEDSRGGIWTTSNLGVARIEKSELLEVLRGERTRVECLLFSESAGLESRQCWGGGQPAGMTTIDGRLWFPTVAGVAVVDPGDVGRPAPPPAVHIEQVTVNDAVLLPGGDDALSRGRGDLRFSYTAVSLKDPSRLRFRYRLEGFEEGWTEAGAVRTASYTNVPAGKYTFMVSAAVGNGTWSEPAARVIDLEPRFWQTRAFSGLLIFLGLGGGLLFYLERTRRERELARLVSERTRDLLEAKNRLEEWNKRQADFVGGASHELRTPLTLICFYVESLLDEPDAPIELRKKWYRIVAREGERLTRLVDRVIRFTRMEAQDQNEKLESGDLNEVVRGTLESFASYMESHGFTVQAQLGSSTPAVLMDGDAVSLAVANLLENAVKYHNGIRRIDVRVMEAEAQVIVEVQDQGLGIDEASQERIFDRFYRESGDGTTGGYGLGLYLVKVIMDMHKGRVELRSRPGQGSLFRLIFPAAEVRMAKEG